VLSLAASAGAGTGPWVTGVLYDRAGSYALAFWLAIVFSMASVVCIWLAGAEEGARCGRAHSGALEDAGSPVPSVYLVAPVAFHGGSRRPVGQHRPCPRHVPARSALPFGDVPSSTSRCPVHRRILPSPGLVASSANPKGRVQTK
jgi:hypothetical protein